MDRELLVALGLLMLCGIALSFAASPSVAERLGLSHWHFVVRHVMFSVPALAVLIATSFLSVRQARVLAIAVLLVSIVMMALALRFGIEVKGAKRWLSIAGLSIQPSEFVKPAFAVIAAWLFAEKMVRRDVPARIISVLVLAVIAGLLVLQPDIGQTALIVLTWAALLFLSGISWLVIFVLGALAVGGIAAAYLMFPHVARRLDAFVNPESGDNYQVERALQSLLEGGWFGRGPGEAMAKRYVPDAHADFVFSAAAGEFGILFCMVLVALIGFIVVRALVAAQAQSAMFPRLAAGALALQFGMQSAINLAVNLNLIPPTGMTLPFVSYGGTSMIAVAFGMGLMLALTRSKPEERLATGLPAYRSALSAQHS